MKKLIPPCARRTIKKVWYWGFARYCPICKSHVRKFYPYGLKNRPDAWCPVCTMLERHRGTWMFLKRKTNLMDGTPKKMMHVAPEKELEKLFRKVKGIDYLSVDLYDPNAMEKVDITNIPYGEAAFDIIYCSHVLEHIPDDKKAVSEFFRVLKPGGWTLIVVPVTDTQTFEDPTITDPKEREKLFGQHDHVRRYGPDVIERIRAAGFQIETFLPNAYMSQNEIVKCGIGVFGREPLFFCRKQKK